MTRRSHTKSRGGCSNCKQRKVKCDEQKPECQKCITRDIVCTYPHPKLVWKEKNDASPSTNTKIAKPRTEPSPPAYSSYTEALPRVPPDHPSLNLENIDLIIHWFTKTVHTVNPVANPAAVQVSQTVILDQAMKHHFLLHGLLALSALHLADSSPDHQKYTDIATAHHTRGLALFHDILLSIDGENCAASIAFSSITLMFMFGLSRPQGGHPANIELVSDLAQILLLGKGWHKVVHVADNLKCRAGLSVSPSPKPHTNTLSPDTEVAFGHLHSLNQGYDRDVYASAINSLKSVFRKMAEEKDDNPHIVSEWAILIPEEFIRLVTERHSLALLIVAHYCVVLHKSPRVWWVNGWSEGLFGVISRSLGVLYQDALQWARLQIESDI
ncbi:hypothetical protein B0J14DRAFT_310239 [Halenospora varia]|nr:hypothetical protein B0J14DRAFT_310239 [Halenospora varia]